MSFNLKKLVLCAFSVSLISGCASQSQYGEVYDPFESSNRVVFALNDILDDNIAKPAAKTYETVLPEPARVGTRNVLRNLSSPLNIGNQLLQGDLSGTMTDIGRALVNSTIGIGGLFDVAGELGMTYEAEDFGQTLAVWGVGDGPYFVIPLLGPSNLRDSSGRLVESFVDPLNLYLENTNQEEWIYARTGVSLVSYRADLLDVLDELESGAIDYYAVMRSSYKQYRDAQIRDANVDAGYYVEIPEYDDE